MIATLFVMMLLGALGGALTIVSVAETQIAGNYRAGVEALAAADAAIELVLNHLAIVPDWRDAHSGAATSPFTDGASSGARHTPAGPIELGRLTALARSAPNAPVWQLYAHAPLADLVSLDAVRSNAYVVVWIAAHPAGAAADTARLLAHAYGPYGVRRAVEAAVARTPISGVRITSWREVH